MTARFFFLSILVSSIIACKKPAPVLPGPSKPAEVLVLLNNPYMTGAKVDSAIATWTVNNKTQQFKLRLHHDTLSASADTLTKGNGKLSVTIFSNIRFNTHLLSRWVMEKEGTIDVKKGIQADGPAGFNDSKWFPRVQLKDVVGHVAVVGMRPEDPYFFVKDVKDNVRELVVARTYWRTKQGVSQVAGREWHCVTNCRDGKGDVENNEFFKFLPAQIGTKYWNHIEIVILYIENQWGGGYVLDFNYDVE